MSRDALQTLVKDLFAEDALRERFVSDPEDLMAQFDLDDEEKQALRELRHRVRAAGTISPEMVQEIEPYQIWF